MKRKLLLVDDSGLARRSMRSILEASDFEVVEAEDGMVALEKYFVERPDVVMLDLVMKGMYGLDVLTKLREMDPTACVIVVSADVQSSSRDMVAGGRRQRLRQQAGRSRASARGDPQRARRVAVVELTPVQQDALIELLNIGFGRAAASLSQLTGHRVLLEVPKVTVHPIDEVTQSLEEFITSDVASVHQIFSGPGGRRRAPDARSERRRHAQGAADQ